MRILIYIIAITTLGLTANYGQAALGDSQDEIEKKKGKPALYKKVNDNISFNFYQTGAQDEVLFFVNGKAGVLYKRPSSGDEFSDEQVKALLEENKSTEISSWELIQSMDSKNEKIYKLKNGDSRLAIWSNRGLVIGTSENIKVFNENEDNFKEFIKNFIQDISKDTSETTSTEVIERGIKNPKEAVLFVMEKRSKGYKNFQFPFIFGSMWFKNNPKEFLQWARTLNLDDFKNASLCANELPKNSKGKDLEQYIVMDMARGEKRNTSIFTLGFLKARQNSDDAIEWASSFSQSDDGFLYAIDGVSIVLSDIEPEKNLEWLISISEKLPEYEGEHHKTPAILIALDSIFKKNKNTALNYALEIKNKKIKQVECFRLAEKYATDNISNFLQYYNKTDESNKKLFAPALAKSFANTSSDKIKETADNLLLVEEFPASGDRSLGDLFGVLISVWANKDYDSCKKWIDKILNEKRVDQLKRDMIYSFIDFNKNQNHFDSRLFPNQ